MNRQVLSVSLICAMLTASFVLVGMTHVKSNPKPVAAPKPIARPVDHPDPPGTINGATNPELVPDNVAWSVILGVIANQKTPEKKLKIRGYIKFLGVGRAKHAKPSDPTTPTNDEADDEADIDKMIAVAEEFETQNKAIETAAGFPINPKSSPPGLELAAKVEKVKKQKEQLIATKVTHLSQSLTPHGYAALVKSLVLVKSRIKISPYNAMPPGK